MISTKEADNKYPVYINKDNNKIAALDYYLDSSITEKTNVYTMYFRAVGEGNTMITLTNPEVVDKNSRVESKIEGLNVSVKEETKEVVTTTTTSVPTTTTTVKTTNTVKPTTTTKAKVEETTTTKVHEVVEEKEEVKSDNILVKLFNVIADFFKNLIK